MLYPSSGANSLKSKNTIDPEDVILLLDSWHSKYCHDVMIVDASFLARAEAVDLGNQLYRHHFFHHVTFDHEFKDEKLFYRLLGDGYARALNAQLSYACIPRPGTQVQSVAHNTERPSFY